jgi:hypothetical protein
MRHIRLRLRSSILFILAALTFLFFITLYTTIWSTDELERQELNRDAPQPPGVIPFWSAINHQNIYDLYATPTNPIFLRRSNITQRRIEELYQLIRHTRTDESQLIDKEKLFPIDPKWDFKKLVAEQNPEPHADTEDSAAKANKITTTTLHPSLTTGEKPVSEYDKIQLRNYIHQVLAQWKKEHQNDKIITLADLMHDELAHEESS